MKKFIKMMYTLGMLCILGGTAYSQATLVKNIYTGNNPTNGNSSPHELTVIDDITYFVANDGTHGNELWKSDGTIEGTFLIKDINPGIKDSNPTVLTNVDGTLFFSANNGTYGNELWKSDGTEEGTVLVKDINPGDGSNPSSLTEVNGILFFSAFHGSYGRELWKSDGTSEGTVLIKNIYPGLPDGISDARNQFINVDGTLFFSGNDGIHGNELWKSDGTTEGTVLVKVIDLDLNRSSNPFNFVNLNDTLLFVAGNYLYGRELWKSDGTPEGTVLVKDINPGLNSSHPVFLRSFKGELIFQADDGIHGGELWKSDGTEEGTELIKDIFPGIDNGTPSLFTEMNGELYFTSNDGIHGFELWKSDGTSGGTVLVKDIFPGSHSSPRDFTNVNGTLFFTAYDFYGFRLWKSDGTDEGTELVDHFSPENLINFNGTLFFTASRQTYGNELWKTDGKSTLLVKDIQPQTNGSFPRSLTNLNDYLIFSANDRINGDALWKSNGSEQSTELIKDIFPGTDSPLRDLTNVNGTLFFTADDGIHGRELWKSDGTTIGTVIVKDIKEGKDDGYPVELTNVNGTLFFRVYQDFWKSDGTEEGTILLEGIAPIWKNTPEELTNVNGTLFFRGNDGYHGRELWKTDGTKEGTKLVKDIDPGDYDSYPSNLTNVNGTLFFSAYSYDYSYAEGLWKSDGTTEGTVKVKDIENCSNFTNVNGTLFFVAYQSNGYELWKSDGTSEGTILVDEVNNKVIPNSITNLFAFGNVLYFSASSGNEGQELWRTDGTAEGTYLAADINPGSSNSNPSRFASIGNTLYFQANDGVYGAELWKYEPSCTEAIPTFSTNQDCAGTRIGFTDQSTSVGTNATYLWDFGDGATSTTKGNVNHNYANPGEYTVTLTITQEECSGSVSQKVTVYPILKVTLSPFDTVSEADAAFALKGGLPSGGSYSGTGVSNGMFDPSSVGVGNYEIIYNYTDPTTNCSDTASQYITVTPALQVNRVVSFTLVNADTDTDIMELTDGMQLYFHALPNAPLNIRTNTDPASVGSVFMSLNGAIDKNQKESVAPYALFGDENGDYGGQNFGIGNYKISATPYTKANLKGEKGTSKTVNFAIKEEVLDCAGFSASLTDVQNVSTCGGRDGSATAGVTGSVGAVTYQWSHGATTAIAGNLPAGDYTVTVSDAQGCSATLSVTIGSPSLPEVSLTPFAPVKETDAAFALSGGSPAGGTYGGGAVSQGMFDPSIGPGSYEIRYIYTDPTTHCTDSAIQYITVEPAIQGDAVVSFTLVNADTDTDILELTDGMQLNLHELPNTPLNIRANTNPPIVGSVSMSLSGPVNKNQKESVAPYALFGDENGDYGGQYFGVGSYTISGTPYNQANLKGEKGMKLSLDFKIVEEVLDCAGFSAALTDVQDVSTCGGNDGSVTVGVTGSGGAVTYEWSHGATIATASNLTAGDYTVTVRDVQGCSTTLSVIIGSPSLPEVTLAPFSAVNEGYPSFTLSGGAPAGGIYSGTGVSNGEYDPFSVGEGNYEITYTYTDPNTGCIGTATEWITVEPLILGIPVHVSGFYLVNADTDRDIMELTDGQQINLQQLPDAPLNIRAETYPTTVNYVILSLSGPLQANRKEGVAPYALFGDENGNFGGKNFEPGSYTLSATPYTLDGVDGEKEEMGLSINFAIIDNQSLSLRTSAAQDIESVKNVEEEMTQLHQEQLEVYPNPFLNTIQMSLSDPNTEGVEVHLIDLFGKSILSKNMEAISGKLEIDVEGKSIPAGTYILKVIWDENVEMIKMIKQN